VKRIPKPGPMLVGALILGMVGQIKFDDWRKRLGVESAGLISDLDDFVSIYKGTTLVAIQDDEITAVGKKRGRLQKIVRWLNDMQAHEAGRVLSASRLILLQREQQEPW